MVVHRRKLLAGAVLAVVGSLAPASWRLAAVKAQPSAQGSGLVRTIPFGQRSVARPGHKGETYYWLESQTRRVTTRFRDATVVAERGSDGDLRSTVRNHGGVEIARFRVDRIDGANDVLQYAPAAGEPFEALNDREVRPTLDWANRQAYSLWKDQAGAAGVTLEWQDGLMRRRGAARRDLERDTLEVHTEWADGLAASALRQSNVRHQAFPGRALRGEVVVNKVSKDGTRIGTASWFPQDQVFFWDLGSHTKGYLDAERLKEVGGWTFTPDAAWLNLQTIAFYHFKTLIDRNRFVARRERPGVPVRALEFFMPTVAANEPGCDGLHWLDGSVFRFCCDVHDWCYEKYGCTSRSWWQIWSSWRCDYCNARAVNCFLGGGYEGPFYQYP